MKGAKGFEERKQSAMPEAEEIVENLALRVKGLREEMDELEGKRLELLESIRDTRVELLEAPVVEAYVKGLEPLLGKGSIMGQKSYLRSFVKRIDRNLPQVATDYTTPLQTKRWNYSRERFYILHNFAPVVGFEPSARPGGRSVQLRRNGCSSKTLAHRSARRQPPAACHPRGFPQKPSNLRPGSPRHSILAGGHNSHPSFYQTHSPRATFASNLRLFCLFGYRSHLWAVALSPKAF